MRAVLATLSPPRYVLTAAAQRLPRGVGAGTGWGPAGVLRLVDDLPAPALPAAPGWVRLRPELSGICGSDVGLAHAKLSFVLSAFYTAQRQVPGHEVVGVVEQVGPGVSAVSEGDRVAVTPSFACQQRGLEPPCRACAAGDVGVCERFDVPGTLGCGGASIGFEAAVGGGWGEQVVAHESQLYPVGAIPSRRAVLAEPASIALHAALRWERRGDRVVVIGAGTIGLLTVAALRMLHPDLDIIVLSASALGTHHALAVGATRVLPSGPGAVEALAASDGGRVLRPRLTRLPILEQGVDAVFDAVASEATIDLGLHLLRSTGTFVMIGAAGRQEVDWSLVWNRSLSVLGTAHFGHERALGGRHAMAQVVQWLGDPAYWVDDLVTHVHPLEHWTQALATAAAGPAAGCVKATLRPNLDVPLVGEAPLSGAAAR
jgi:threonine dehydrogenase-like Zn-dependent dehydrogenase